jgi:hypothetical protein
MPKQFLLACLLMASLTCLVSAAPEDFRRTFIDGTHRSLSGQFVIRDPESVEANFRVKALPDNMVKVNADVLTVSCERIKTALLRQLDMRDGYRGKIFINLFRSQGDDIEITAAATRIGPDWVYRLDMPDIIDRDRLINGIVEMLLLEMANQDSDHSVELPVWLVRGMGRQVVNTSPIQLVIDQPRTSVNGLFLSKSSGTNRMDELGLTRQLLQDHPPLTLDELSWPADGQFEGVSALGFDASAHLLVHELFDLKDGRAKLVNMLMDLHNHLNWQLAFLNAFGDDFENQLAFAKWWELRVVHFTGRNLAQAWPPDISWRKLDDTLHANVDVRSDADQLPVSSEITLQAVIRNWDLVQQARVIQIKINELNALRLNVSQDLVYFVQDYATVLGDYLRKRAGRTSADSSKTIYPPPYDRVARSTVEQLDALDARRLKLKPNPMGEREMTMSPAPSN